LALVSGAVVALAGCGSDGGSEAGGSGGSNGFDELYDQGLTKYVDEFNPDGEPTFDEENGITTFRFAVPGDRAAEPRGPLCLRGTEYTVDTREGTSDELVIFLQGGGACWDTFCSAFEETNFLRDNSGGILDPVFSLRVTWTECCRAVWPGAAESRAWAISAACKTSPRRSISPARRSRTQAGSS
jgi:hypothetical protein